MVKPAGGVNPPISTLLSALTPAPYALGALSAVLLLVERVLGVTIAVRLVEQTPSRALLFTGLLAVVFAMRGATRGALRVRARALVHAAAVDALLTGDVVRTSPLADDDAQTAVHEGAHRSVLLISETLPNVMGDALGALVLGAYAVVVQPARVVAVGGVALVVAALAVVAVRRITLGTEGRAWRAYMPVYEDLLTALGARLELVANGKHALFRADTEKRLDEYRRAAAQAERLSAAAGRAPVLAAALAVAGVLLLDRSVRGSSGTTSLADVAVFASIVPAFLGLTRGAHEIQQKMAGLRPLASLLAVPRRAHGGTAPVPPLPATVIWRDVAYAYPRPDGQPAVRVLAHLSIRWDHGQILLFAGPNGSGKSTCVRLLLGLARPLEGEITVGGVDLFSLDLSRWRQHIAYLPQRPFLAERATVRAAMKLLARDASDEALEAALVRIDVWRTLGGRGESPLDVRIGTLSAGQRQRVAVARVLALDTPLLVFDEPDANLDAEGIRLVSLILKELAATRMVVVIAHTDQLIALGGTLVKLS